jgi:hypothetical protein
MNNKFSPGPWHIHYRALVKDLRETRVRNANNGVVCLLKNSGGDKQANAQLIAAIAKAKGEL